MTGWTVSYRRADDSAVTQLASGTGTAVSATIDPTTMPNGGYELVIRATSSDGGVTVSETSFVVDGQLKLGRYQVTYQDLNVPVAGIPLRVLRTYDSFDKSRGDFGVGWRLDLDNFRISTNGPLGEGGWTMSICGAGLIFFPTCFTSSRPHFVTVTWPDGRTEIFDLTPARGSTFLCCMTSAQFTGRPNTTSKLAFASPNRSASPRAAAMAPSEKSYPVNLLAGNAWAMRLIAWPLPQPMSATSMPAFSRSGRTGTSGRITSLPTSAL